MRKFIESFQYSPFSSSSNIIEEHKVENSEFSKEKWEKNGNISKKLIEKNSKKLWTHLKILIKAIHLMKAEEITHLKEIVKKFIRNLLKLSAE